MIADDIARELPNLQLQAESMQIDICTVRRPTGTVTDPLTGLDSTTYTTVYGGKCRLKAANVMAREADSVGSQVTEQPFTLEVPNSAPALLPGDLATFDPTTVTPRLRGMKARVDGVHVGTHTTAQRVPVTILAGVV